MAVLSAYGTYLYHARLNFDNGSDGLWFTYFQTPDDREPTGA